MSNKLTDIRNALESALAGMTVVGGYNYNYHSDAINPENADPESVHQSKFPFVNFYFESEFCENPLDNTITTSNVVTVLIDLIPEKTRNTSDGVDKCIQDIKRLAGNNHSISGACFMWWYESHKRFFIQTEYPEYGARITAKIKYFEDRQNP